MEDLSLSSLALWQPFIDALAASAPGGTAETTFEGSFSRSSWGGLTLDDGSNDERYKSRDRSRSGGLDAAAESVRRAVGDRHCNVFVRARRGADDEHHASGEVVVVELPEGGELGVGKHDAAVVPLVAEAVAEPYRRTPVFLPESRESHAARAETVVELVRGALPDATGLTESELDLIETSLGRALPSDVRALFSVASSGDLVLPSPDADDPDPVDVMQIISPFDTDARYYLAPLRRAGSWKYAATEVVAPDPDERVQTLAASSAWYPIGDDWGGSYYVVDLAPGPRGTVGQVLYIERSASMGARWVAPSLTEFLLELPESLSPSIPTGSLSVRMSQANGIGFDAISPTTEVVIIQSGVAGADLSQLSGHPRVRTLTVGAGAATRLDALATVPRLEYLELCTDDWRTLIEADAVPAGLLAAGVTDARSFEDQLQVIEQLSARGTAGRPVVTRLSSGG